MALAFPSGPTPGQQYTGPNGVVYEWDNTLGAWVKVNAVQTSVAGAAAATSAARIPVGTTVQQPLAASNLGAIRYNLTVPELQYSDGANWLPVGAVPASLAEAAAGTLTDKYSSPKTAVPKDAAGMTGAAIIPSGTDAQRAAISPLVVGMQRFNTEDVYPEVYTGVPGGWKQLTYNSAPVSTTDLTWSGAVSAASAYLIRDLTVASGATITPSLSGTYVYATGTVTINASTWNFQGAGGIGPVGTASPASGTTACNSGTGPSGGSSSYGTPAFATPPSALLGSGGASGGGGGGGTGGTGGNGGGYIYIYAEGGIVVSGAVTFNIFGIDGTSGNVKASGGAGGSGGSLVLVSPSTITLPATVTIDVHGGNGANGVAGGPFFFNGDAGGGGGGGWIVLQSPALSDSSSKNLAGGAPGVTSDGGAGVPGAGGGGSAGRGGQGGYGAAGIVATAGSAGIVSYVF